MAFFRVWGLLVGEMSVGPGAGLWVVVWEVDMVLLSEMRRRRPRLIDVCVAVDREVLAGTRTPRIPLEALGSSAMQGSIENCPTLRLTD